VDPKYCVCNRAALVWSQEVQPAAAATTTTTTTTTHTHTHTNNDGTQCPSKTDITHLICV